MAKCVTFSDPFNMASTKPGASFCKTAFVACNKRCTEQGNCSARAVFQPDMQRLFCIIIVDLKFPFCASHKFVLTSGTRTVVLMRPGHMCKEAYLWCDISRRKTSATSGEDEIHFVFITPQHKLALQRSGHKCETFSDEQKWTHKFPVSFATLLCFRTMYVAPSVTFLRFPHEEKLVSPTYLYLFDSIGNASFQHYFSIQPEAEQLQCRMVAIRLLELILMRAKFHSHFLFLNHTFQVLCTFVSRLPVVAAVADWKTK